MADIFGTVNGEILEGGAGDDFIFGGPGPVGTTYNSYVGNDILRGNDGNDVLLGSHNDDLLEGGVGDDILYGENGSDVLNGGAGDDLIYDSFWANAPPKWPRSANGTVDGGDGVDTFRFDSYGGGVVGYSLRVDLSSSYPTEIHHGRLTILNIENV